MDMITRVERGGQADDLDRGALVKQEGGADRGLARRAGHDDCLGAEEGVVVEKVVDAASRHPLIFSITNRDSFDAASRRVVEMLAATEAGIWIVSDGDEPELPRSRFFIVAPSMSQKTGRAPARTMTFAVAGQVSGVVITSSPSPSPMPSARSARYIAAVQEETASATGDSA